MRTKNARNITVELPEDLHTALAALAKAQRSSRSRIIILALEAYLDAAKANSRHYSPSVAPPPEPKP